MSGLYPLIFSLVVLTIFSILEILLIRTLNRVWWKHKFVRWGAYFLPLFGMLSIIVWFGTSYYRFQLVGRIASLTVAISLVLMLGLTLSLPISGILNFAHHLLEKRKKKQAEKGGSEPDPNRRIVLKGAAAALPLLTLSMGASGVARAFQETRVYLRAMIYNNLPQQLNGFKILHLTDLHLGIYKFLDDLEKILENADKFKPDLILITGDIADDLSLLPEVLKMVEASKPKYGAFACLGNHEYYRGITEVLSIFEKSAIPLLKSYGTTIYINGVPLYLAGADDPHRLRYDNTPVLRDTIGRAIAGAPEGAFRVLLSHRPEGFEIAAERGIELTLSGHTHGGQVGFGGRSFFSPFMPGRYLWGRYERGSSQLYLSSGIGHWFPFRLGCPPEAPVIELISRT
ncbi:MAG: metallophosphoesterase [candidate division Zixibacteria bacterium]|nr:metallophosphoesterase [candidate division Zixibacteria bacterium]